jgi:hypothetical protein
MMFNDAALDISAPWFGDESLEFDLDDSEPFFTSWTHQTSHAVQAADPVSFNSSWLDDEMEAHQRPDATLDESLDPFVPWVDEATQAFQSEQVATQPQSSSSSSVVISPNTANTMLEDDDADQDYGFEVRNGLDDNHHYTTHVCAMMYHSVVRFYQSQLCDCCVMPRMHLFIRSGDTGHTRCCAVCLAQQYANQMSLGDNLPFDFKAHPAMPQLLLSVSTLQKLVTMLAKLPPHQTAASLLSGMQQYVFDLQKSHRLRGQYRYNTLLDHLCRMATDGYTGRWYESIMHCHACKVVLHGLEQLQTHICVDGSLSE